MKKIVMILMALVIVSCQEKNDSTDVTGTAEGIEDGTKIMVYSFGTGATPIDTAVVKNETFTIDLPSISTQTLNSLTVENVRGNVIFINANEPLTMELYKDSLRSSIIKGGKHNALLTKYANHLKEFGKKMNNLVNQFRDPASANNPERIAKLQAQKKKLIEKNKAYRQKLIENNPNSIVAAMILSDIMRAQSLPVSEIKKLYEGLAKEVKKTSVGKQVEDLLKMVSATAIGNVAPAFSGPTPSGKTLALKDVLGEVTLIDFWASWCKPCRAENPNIVQVYEKYHDKGFNIIQVSLDKQKEKWVNAIEEDGLVWNHVSYLKFWQDPIARKYNVRSIPAAFLVDENGVIVAKDLRGEELGKKVAELLES